jgi:RimJ/RimL family protein N-acetyltransferase
MTSPHWPLTGLRLRTPRLELRWPTLSDLDELAALAVDGVHDPGVQPFFVAWTDAPAAELASRSLRYYWAQWGAWRLNDWTLHLVAVHDGVIVGTQAMRGRDFAVLREVSTGSWLGRRYHRQGMGTEMRAAVLALAFDGLHAEYAVSTANRGNAASLGVSRRLGYAKDGIERLVVRDRPVTAQRLRLDRAAWRAHSSLQVETSGLEACLPWFGLAS